MQFKGDSESEPWARVSVSVSRCPSAAALLVEAIAHHCRWRLFVARCLLVRPLKCT